MGIRYRIDYTLGGRFSEWTEFTTRNTYGEAKELAKRLLASVVPPSGIPPRETRVMKIEATEIRIFPDREDM